MKLNEEELDYEDYLSDLCNGDIGVFNRFLYDLIKDGKIICKDPVIKIDNKDWRIFLFGFSSSSNCYMHMGVDYRGTTQKLGKFSTKGRSNIAFAWVDWSNDLKELVDTYLNIHKL